MNLFRIVLFGLLLPIAACGPANPTLKAITGATLLDGTSQPAVADAVIIVNGDEIQAAGPQDTTAIPQDARKYDAKGKFVVPGLIDVRSDIPTDAAKAAPLLRALVRAGITTIGVADGGSVARDVSPRMLPAGTQAAGFADLVIASSGSTPAAYFAKIGTMAKAELTPQQILTAATRSGSQWLKQDRLGVIAAGRKADLLLLSADPRLDARNLAKVARVMLDGTWIE